MADLLDAEMDDADLNEVDVPAPTPVAALQEDTVGIARKRCSMCGRSPGSDLHLYFVFNFCGSPPHTLKCLCSQHL
eukprot:1207616-Amphidinium_carterae.1